MARKKPDITAIETLVRQLRCLHVRLFKTTTGDWYLTTRHPERGLVTQPHDSKATYTELKWVLLRAQIEFTHDLLVLAVECLKHGAESTAPVPVSLRVAERCGKLYVDLCDPQRRAVEITADGWKIVTEHPVTFVRPASALPLPEPKRAGSVELLREVLGISDETTWVLLLGWLCAAIRENGSHMLLAVNGDPGAGKTTLTKYLSRVLDPRDPQSIVLTPNGENLHLSASSRWVVSLDEVDALTGEKSRIVSTICTGGGMEKRKLYEDRDTVSISIRRPMILNGLGDWVREPRILSRSVPVYLSPRGSKQRRTDSQIETRFDTVWPELLGGLFSLASAALRSEQVNEETGGCPIRMLDAGQWADRCLKAAGYGDGVFTRAVRAAQDRIEGSLLDDWVLLAPLRQVAEIGFSGSPTALLEVLCELPGAPTRDRNWPKVAGTLTKEINAHLADLRKQGIVAEYSKSQTSRAWTLRLESSRSLNSCTLPPIPEHELNTMRQKFATHAEASNSVLIAFQHSDGSHTLYGKSAKGVAQIIHRPVQPDETLRITAPEWISAQERSTSFDWLLLRPAR